MIPSLLWRCSSTTEGMTPVSQQANLPSAPLQAAEQLLHEGRPVEASHLLADALAQGESPDLWNDWAAAQLSLSERAFRRQRRCLSGNLLRAQPALRTLSAPHCHSTSWPLRLSRYCVGGLARFSQLRRSGPKRLRTRCAGNRSSLAPPSFVGPERRGSL